MNWNKVENKRLIRAILSLRIPDEVQRFLRDLLTEGEIKEFAGRLRTAEMLANKVPYSDITRATGLSSTTIARVSKWLHHGSGGYQLVLERLAH
jgi:TrpR-related protein YerC/YecD